MGLKACRLLGLIFVVVTALGGCATTQPVRHGWFLVSGPYESEAICIAGRDAARATIAARADQAGRNWTWVCELR
jgi:hypothetical protein